MNALSATAITALSARTSVPGGVEFVIAGNSRQRCTKAQDDPAHQRRYVSDGAANR
jgi:hypothetical protein